MYIYIYIYIIRELYACMNEYMYMYEPLTQLCDIEILNLIPHGINTFEYTILNSACNANLNNYY